ncbi:response regulator transcription factor [Alphaproteobacteria bacterium]|jgi:two-component system, OmpR family, response regulator|nr:response regulator transcription factor [Alphaproteobacteria bacterium]
MKVLIIEDDLDIARQLSDQLKSSGFVPVVANDGEEGLHQLTVENWDAALLDIGLPIIDGFALLEKCRAEGKSFPIIILTARTNKMEMIKGLEAGADDYIYKPFDMAEVIARVRSNIRRHKGQLKPLAAYKAVSLDWNSGRVTRDALTVALTRIEFLMVQYLFLNQGRSVSVTELTEHVYDDFDHDSSIIARHIANIRKKLGADIILTESNRGYTIPSE